MANPEWNRYSGQPEAAAAAAKQKRQAERAEVRAAIEALDRRKAEIAAREKADEEK